MVGGTIDAINGIEQLLRHFIEELQQTLKRIRRPIVLERAGAIRFAVDVGQLQAESCVVVASLAGTNQPSRGAPVRFRVLSGSLRLTGGSREAQVNTDEHGRAAIGVEFTRRGTALVAAELVDDAERVVYFEGHSDRTTHSIYVYTEPTFPADPGIVRARLSALDHHEHGVTGADIAVEAQDGRSVVVTGTVRELGGGLYEAELLVKRAGTWTLVAYDKQTRASSAVSIQALPGPAAQFTLVGDADPRKAKPYAELLLRARIEDKYGNPLDPHRVRAERNGAILAPSAVVGDEIRFLLGLAGYSEFTVTLSDSTSDLRRDIPIVFASSWLADPGVVLTGTRFQTPLYWAPPANRPIAEAKITLHYPVDLVHFVGFNPTASPGLQIQHTVTNGSLAVALSADPLIDASHYPEGLHIGDIVWDCAAEGQTCFDLSVTMSPDTPVWEMCVKQKRENQKCICVNLVYQAGTAAGTLTAARDAIRRIGEILGQLGNVERCCPYVRVDRRECEISVADWTATIVPATGADGAITNATEQEAVLRADLCQRARCINFLIAPLNWHDGRIGSTYVSTPPGVAYGFGVLDPGSFAQDPNIAAHEAGHALGLRDEADRHNLMGPGFPSGVNLTETQCETVGQQIDAYRC
ncbi:MAG: hypothetical protein ACKV22_17210 [Bryobacteraceae bacterium]